MLFKVRCVGYSSAETWRITFEGVFQKRTQRSYREIATQETQQYHRFNAEASRSLACSPIMNLFLLASVNSSPLFLVPSRAESLSARSTPVSAPGRMAIMGWGRSARDCGRERSTDGGRGRGIGGLKVFHSQKR